MEAEKSNRAGKKFVTKEGYEIQILDYFGSMNCTVTFTISGLTLHNVAYKRVQNGSIKNVLHPRIRGVGYIGKGTYKSEVGGKAVKEYYVWSGMLERCFSGKLHKWKNTYKDVTVCEEWHNYQNFAKWFEENYIEGFHLDKDILVKGNKIYSPETCCFVPQIINSIFTKRGKNRGEYPIGVNFNKGKNKFEANINKNGKGSYLGTFNTPEEAFQAYKTAKESYIKEVADKWEGQITEKTYQSLTNYKIEITD